MVRFLLHRPIAVFMSFIALIMIGAVSYLRVPVSLLPNISIPEISVQITGQQQSAQQLETAIVAPIRQQLLQVSQLVDIRSEVQDESAIIRLNFSYGVNTDLAFIEVNEKIDALMSLLPKNTKRPKVVKASATDIPVFNLNISLKSDLAYHNIDNAGFLQLSEFTDLVIKRRIEQLSEVAMVDISGLPSMQISIRPNTERLTALGLSISDIENAITANNLQFGSMQVREGHYQYNIKFSTAIRDIHDLENIYINTNQHLLQLKDIASVTYEQQDEKGRVLSDGRKALCLSIIKQANAHMKDLQKSLNDVCTQFQQQYPDINFSITQNQTELLEYTINNLSNNLLQGFLLVCLVSVFFIQSIRTPLIIACCVLVALIISLLFFGLFKMTLNIISLSGLILTVGMMVDNSIIVTDTIRQYRQLGLSTDEACIKGTEEVMIPMLSSMLTTIAVFVPMVFMSGIAGALFWDQALAVTIGLICSYFTGILLLPVLYHQVYAFKSRYLERFRERIKMKDHLQIVYDKGIDWVFSHQLISVSFLILALPMCYLFFQLIDKERMPQLESQELIVRIDWNEHIHIHENQQRVNRLMKKLQPLVMEHTVLIGTQQFILQRDRLMAASEAEIYLKVYHADSLVKLKQAITQNINQNYSKCVYTFQPPPTVFEKVFVTSEADLLIELYPKNNQQLSSEQLLQIKLDIEQASQSVVDGLVYQKQINLHIDYQKLLLYNINYAHVHQTIRTALKNNKITDLHNNQQSIPIFVETDQQSMQQIVNTTFVRTQTGETIPLRNFVSLTDATDMKSITAGKLGTYYPFVMQHIKADKLPLIEHALSKHAALVEFHLSGQIFKSKQLISEMFIILLVSLLLMYFILAAQFESFRLPLIVLLEIPIDAAAALVTLYLLGHSLNLMSAIGIIVTCGIVINDSILKISLINELRKENVPLMEAIHTVGHRRLRAIIMTSLTTILAMVPILFSFDMGSELQKPLAIATISAMIVGTLVSLFIIPLVYYLIYRKTENSHA